MKSYGMVKLIKIQILRQTEHENQVLSSIIYEFQDSSFSRDPYQRHWNYLKK